MADYSQRLTVSLALNLPEAKFLRFARAWSKFSIRFIALQQFLRMGQHTFHLRPTSPLTKLSQQPNLGSVVSTTKPWASYRS